jgi:6-phosphogluconolactonase/glucosamine-6-phosphate isomerase/deaminase
MVVWRESRSVDLLEKTLETKSVAGKGKTSVDPMVRNSEDPTVDMKEQQLEWRKVAR